LGVRGLACFNHACGDEDSLRPAADGQDEVTRLLPRLDAARRLDDYRQRVTTIDDRPVPSGLDQPFQEDGTCLRVTGDSQIHPLVADPPGQRGQQGRLR
jgi:hypothetical protein